MLTFLYVLHFLVCFILIGVVLLQRGKGQDLGASLGGGGANTIFGSRGAGNFLTKMTTGSAIIFMITSLSLSYLGYKSSDARLFDESEPFVPEGATVPKPDSGLEEIPAAAAGGAEASEDAGGLVEVPNAEAASAPDAAASAANAEPAAAGAPASDPANAGAPAVNPDAGAAAAEASDSAPAAMPAPKAGTQAEETKQP